MCSKSLFGSKADRFTETAHMKFNLSFSRSWGSFKANYSFTIATDYKNTQHFVEDKEKNFDQSNC